VQKKCCWCGLSPLHELTGDRAAFVYVKHMDENPGFSQVLDLSALNQLPDNSCLYDNLPCLVPPEVDLNIKDIRATRDFMCTPFMCVHGSTW